MKKLAWLSVICLTLGVFLACSGGGGGGGSTPDPTAIPPTPTPVPTPIDRYALSNLEGTWSYVMGQATGMLTFNAAGRVTEFTNSLCNRQLANGSAWIANGESYVVHVRNYAWCTDRSHLIKIATNFLDGRDRQLSGIMDLHLNGSPTNYKRYNFRATKQ
ncbi:MAG: hypothetical protein KQJ78_20850 [Deltaproteobacteria bacterium]|nr:hypothetical protein [Deltaproteobacteria bacterium]